ncbi:MAG: RHS repeat protein, partial [Phycisphaerales bacterium]|nr:RHS repeat protein [Phycisphaerales bacterium]
FLGGGSPNYYTHLSTHILPTNGGRIDLAGSIGVNPGAAWNDITIADSSSSIRFAANSVLTHTQLVIKSGAHFTLPATSFVRWGASTAISITGTGTTFDNRGTLVSIASSVAISVDAASTFTNRGVVQASTGSAFVINGSVTHADGGFFSGEISGRLTITGDLLGDTHSAGPFNPKGTVVLPGAVTASAPQRLEAMSQDHGDAAAGFTGNFVYGTLSFGAGDAPRYVKLVNQSDNFAGNGAEAIYAQSVIVAKDTTLDLGGLHVYTRALQQAGTVIHGSITVIPDTGPLTLSVPTPGSISESGQVDDWRFYSPAGRAATIVVNPGGSSQPAALPEYLNWAQVQLFDPKGTKLAEAICKSSGSLLTLSGIALPIAGEYVVRIRAAQDNNEQHMASKGNYILTGWDVTPDVSSLALNQLAVGAIESPYAIDQWNFSALAGQQVRFDLKASSSLGLAFNLTGPNGYSAFTDLTADSALINLPSSGSYTLTALGLGGVGGTYSFVLQQTSVTELPLGTPYTGTLAGSGQAQLFKLSLATSGTLRINLDDSSISNANELYLRFGSAPTRADYDYRFSSSVSPDQQIIVPAAYVGTWYALVYGNSVVSPSAYTLSAAASQITVTSITPDHYSATATAQVTVRGAGFVEGTTVELVSSTGIPYTIADVVIDSFQQITATIPAGAVPADLAHPYSVRVSRIGADPGILNSAFTMKPSGGAHLETHLTVPSNLGRHATATIYVEYANTGDAAMPAPLLVLSSGDPDGSDKPLLTLDINRLSGGFWTSAIPEGFGTSVQFLASGAQAGILQPGERRQVPVYYAGLLEPWDFSDGAIEFQLGVLDTSNSAAIDWSSFKDSMRPEYVRSDAWDAAWSNFVSNVGTTWGDYLAMLDANARFLDRLGAGTNEISRLLGFELRQAEGLNPIRALVSTSDMAISTPGLDITFARTFLQPLSRRFEIGRTGRGWSDNWQWALKTQSDGTIGITDPTGTPRIFQPDSRSTGRYIPAPGDHGELLQSGGSFTLRELDGSISAYRGDGKLDYVQDANGNRITCGYTEDRLTSLKSTSGHQLTLAYNAAGRLATITDPDGRKTRYSYDASGEHLISVQEYDGRITQFAYLTGQGASREHALSQISYPDGSRRTFAFDSRGRLVGTAVDGEAESVQFTYDSAGAVSVTNAANAVSLFYFDDWGTILKVTNPLGSSVGLTLDALRNVTVITDPAGRATRYEYDSLGNVIGSTDAIGATTRFSYTANLQQLASLTDANGNKTAYSYDAKGNLTHITYANGSIERWLYDASGQVTRWTNARGQALNLTWNADGLLTRKDYSDGSHADYTYDTRGNLTKAVDSDGTTVFTYNASDYLTRIDFPGGQKLTFTYDAGARRSTSTDQTGHKLTYSYDAAGRLSKIVDETASVVVAYQYDAVGRLSRKTLGNGVYTTYEYDAAGQLLHLINKTSAGATLSRFDYTYDSRGRRIAMGTSYGTWSYEYDDIGQLTHAVLASTDANVPNQDLRYIYDALGNRIQSIENGVTVDYTANSMNQYTKTVSSADGQTTYTFDADGNLIEQKSGAGTTTYSYDQENRLIAVQRGAESWSYEYNALGQRAASTRGGATTRYVVDPIGWGNVVGEYDNAGTRIARYDHGSDLLSRSVGAGTSWYTFDALGNTVELSSSIASTEARYTFAPFGQLIQQSGAVSTPFQFVGQFGVMRDDTDRYSMRLRWYDPEIGRFSGADPLGTWDGVNVYAYCANKPTSLVDYSGLCGAAGPLREEGGLEGADLGMDVHESLGISAAGGAFDEASTSKIAKPPVSAFFGRFFYAFGIFSTIKSSIDQARAYVGLVSQVLDSGNQMLRDGLAGGTYCAPSRKPALPPGVPTDPLDSGGGATSGANDPNDKLGPSGFGASHFIPAGQYIPYRINFENDASATAPAQIVTITDALSADLDWTTFSFTGIGFGDHTLTFAPGTQYIHTTIPVEIAGRSFEVLIEGGINLQTGLISITFYSLDPATQLPPEVLAGFLPPEDGTGRGMGYVTFSILPKPGLPSGTRIRNIAQIIFDGQPPIATNQKDPHDPSAGVDTDKEALVTVDAAAPTSTIAALPTSASARTFTLSWSGTDDVGGSGIAGYNIYVSTDGGQYMLWMPLTAGTSAAFTGEHGHTYRFYSLAVDNTGLEESAPSAADATISLIGATFGAAQGQQVGASASSSGGVNVTVQNAAGSPIILQLPANHTIWTGADLRDKTGCPQITGEVVTWVDPRDGLTYAAAMSAEGLLLLTNTVGTNWTFRNLSTEVPTAPAISGNLTVFTSTDQFVNIAGVTAAGDLIRWQQTGEGGAGNYTWAANNLADDLRNQGLPVPRFVGRITSFVTPWNALNIVGLDGDGQIQAIWWHQSLATGGKWTTNNLSAEYGAPALTGGLTVWLTSWNAINIAGTDTAGKLSTTWWVPGFNEDRWNNTTLTDLVSGPLLQPDSMTSWVTSWGAMNVAGREADGTMSVYWWVPNYNGNNWQVTHFRDILPGTTSTTGPVTGITAVGGDNSMSIISTSDDGDVIRLWWEPATNAWAEENMTQTAISA